MRSLLVVTSVVAGLALTGCANGAQSPENSGQSGQAGSNSSAMNSGSSSTQSNTPPVQQDGDTSTSGSMESHTSPVQRDGDTPSSNPPDLPGVSNGKLHCNVITNRAGVEFDLYSKLRGPEFIGCEDANNVMGEYLSLPADQYQGSGRFAMVMGHQCGTDGDRRIACVAKDGLSILATMKK